MSDSRNSTAIFISLGGSDIAFLKRLVHDLRGEVGALETHPPRSLGVYLVGISRPGGQDDACTKIVRSRRTTFGELVHDFDWDLHREKTRDDCVFVHVDDVIEPLLGQIKTNFIHFDGHGLGREAQEPLINDIARDATRAGCGVWLAWTAGELLDHGASAAYAGRAFIHQLMTQDIDEETRAVLALLADLKPRQAKLLPLVRAQSLRKESVIATSTILRDAERAMQWVASLKGGAQTLERLRPLFENELFALRRCMVDDEPLLRWLGLAATQLVMRETCRVMSGMAAHLHAPFVRLMADWITHDVGTERGTSIFAASKLLPLLWGWFPAVMPREAGVRLEKADLAVQSCLLSSAFDALETGFRGRKQADIPDFVVRAGQLRYSAPDADPWKGFGIVVARVANQNSVLRSQVELKVARLRLWRRWMVHSHATDDFEQIRERSCLCDGEPARFDVERQSLDTGSELRSDRSGTKRPSKKK